MMSEWLKCDQCVAQAMWEAKKDEMYLYFCGHHKNIQEDKLTLWAEQIIELLSNEQEMVKTE